MKTIALPLDEIYSLARDTLINNGCDELNAEAVAVYVTKGDVTLLSSA